MGQNNTSLRDFIEDTTWVQDDRLIFMLYTIRSRDTPELLQPNLTGWPQGTKSELFILKDEPWPIIVELWEIYTPDLSLPEDIEPLLIKLLADRLANGSVLSWYMFEGTFGDITLLFGLGQTEGTYGVAWPGQPPLLALYEQERRSPHWENTLAKAARYLYTAYPDLKTMYLDSEVR